MSLLLSERPLLVLPSLAVLIGLNEAIVLQQVKYWVEHNKQDPTKRETHFINGRWWTYNTYGEWRDNFPFWSVPTIRRTISSLESKGLLLSCEFNKDKRDRTKWYSIDEDRLNELNCSQRSDACDQIDQMEEINLIKSSGSNRSDHLYTETSSETSNNQTPLTPQGEVEREPDQDKSGSEPVDQNLPLRCQENRTHIARTEDTGRARSSAAPAPAVTDKFAGQMAARAANPGHRYPGLAAMGLGHLWVGPKLSDFMPEAEQAAIAHLKKHDRPHELGDARRYISNMIRGEEWAKIELLLEDAEKLKQAEIDRAVRMTEISESSAIEEVQADDRQRQRPKSKLTQAEIREMLAPSLQKARENLAKQERETRERLDRVWRGR